MHLVGMMMMHGLTNLKFIFYIIQSLAVSAYVLTELIYGDSQLPAQLPIE